MQPRGAHPRMQPVVRQEGAAPTPAAAVAQAAANIIPITRAQTAREHRNEEKAQRAAAALAWTPDRTEPSPRQPEMIPQPVVAEGSRPVSFEYQPPAPAPKPAPIARPIAPPVAPPIAQPVAPPVAPPVARRAKSPVIDQLPLPPEPAPVYVPRAPAADRWAVYQQLGLGPRVTKKQTAQQWMVSTYRALGFLILTIIVVVLVGYILTTAFYFWNSTWIQPMVVSPTDEKVLAMQAQVAQQENERDKIAAELTAVERELTVEQDFQSQFAAAIRADLAGRRLALSRVRGLANQYAGARANVQRSNQAYAAASARQMRQEYQAGLMDRSEMLSGKFQLAQITTANLGLAEREAEFSTRASELDQEAKALEGLLDDKGGDGALSYDVLRIKQEYEKSRLATARAMANREALRAALAREKTVLDGLLHQPYLRALADHATVAFIPYGNMGNIAKGTTLYSCSMDMFWCHSVGTVREVLPGEVQFKHPQREKMLRGQLVELDLDADEVDAAARKNVLFLGGRPLWL